MCSAIVISQLCSPWNRQTQCKNLVDSKSVHFAIVQIAQSLDDANSHFWQIIDDYIIFRLWYFWFFMHKFCLTMTDTASQHWKLKPWNEGDVGNYLLKNLPSSLFGNCHRSPAVHQLGKDSLMHVLSLQCRELANSLTPYIKPKVQTAWFQTWRRHQTFRFVLLACTPDYHLFKQRKA